MWHQGTLNGNIATCRIKISEHNNEQNCYYLTHIYAWDSSGNNININQEQAQALLVYMKSASLQQPSQMPANVHFAKTNLYIPGQFQDIPANQWFTPGVEDAFCFGLMKGIGSNTFGPYGDVTIAEAFTMASRIHCIYSAGHDNIRAAGPGENWYQPYLEYAFQNGIIPSKDYRDPNQRISRLSFAEMFASALPDSALPAINHVADNAIPDVSMSDDCASAIYKLYRAGILAGNDVNGTFSPLTYITRAECAVIVSRMAESNNRVSFTLR